MSISRILAALVLAGSLAACVSTAHFAPEYSQHYFLAEDVHLYRCHTFTGVSSAWLTGPEEVETICSATIPVARAALIKKGSAVRILKIFTVSGIDATSRQAKLEVIDGESKAAHVVYINWPGSKGLLATESPGLLRSTP